MNLYEQMEQVAARLEGAAEGTIASQLSKVLFAALDPEYKEHPTPGAAIDAMAKYGAEAHEAAKTGPDPKRDWGEHTEGAPETSDHCEDLQTANRRLAEQLRDVKEQRDWNAKCLQDLKGELIKSNDEANSLREDLASHRALVKKMSGERDERARIQDKLAASEQTAERLHKTNRSLGEYVIKAEAERDKFAAEITTLKDLLTTHAKERAELLERKATIESRLETRTHERNQYMVERDELAEKLREVEKERDWDAKCLQDLKGELGKEATDAGTLRIKLEDAEDEIKDLQNERDELAKKLREMQAEIKDLKDANEIVRANRDEYRKKYHLEQATLREFLTEKGIRPSDVLGVSGPVGPTGLTGRSSVADPKQSNPPRAETTLMGDGFSGELREVPAPWAGKDDPVNTRPAESDGDMLKRIGLDGVLWADEFTKVFVRTNRDRMSPSLIQDLKDLALGWFCNAFHAAQTYSPRNKSGDVIWQSPPTDDQIANWSNSGFFDHFSDAARMAMEHCHIPIHRYVALQKIFETFGGVQRSTVHLYYAGQSEAKADTELNGYGQGIVDSAQRLKNVLDREGLLPKDGHPEDAQ